MKLEAIGIKVLGLDLKNFYLVEFFGGGVDKAKQEKAGKSDFFGAYFSGMSAAIASVDSALLEHSAEIIWHAKANGGKVILVGNGGSAAMASHLSVDLTKAAGVRAINFNEADLLTCFANDFGYENWVARALEAYADKSDVVVLISSSGKSPNILNGVAQARKMGLSVISLSGFKNDNPLRQLGDINFWCNSEAYNIVEMTHHVWLLSIVDYIIQSKST
jgi:D-sedoheptulose 7-phosphate isomerase